MIRIHQYFLYLFIKLPTFRKDILHLYYNNISLKWYCDNILLVLKKYHSQGLVDVRKTYHAQKVYKKADL